MLYYKRKQREYGGDQSMKPRISPQAPDSPDIDDLIFEGEHPEESEK